jgi:glyoxylase-like metal-dependent hydrolase (beta-lactamase superfamily II)
MFVSLVPPGARRFLSLGQGRPVVVEVPWGRLEQVGEGLWALISTPLTGDRTTLCNGGIIVGSAGTLVVESFASPTGAAWMAEQARALTGRWPTHVVLTHFHGDHTYGIEGYEASATPDLIATEVTRELVLRADAERGVGNDSLRRRMLADVVILDPVSATDIDLGGRSVRVVPRQGHTPSDVTVELDDPSVVWCGDLVWNRMFPNYRDAVPSRLSRDVRALVRSHDSVYVPGHGPLAGTSDLESYMEVIDLVEQAARRAHERGIAAAQAAEDFQIPESLGEWTMFSPRYHEVALSAWEKELR